ncbi:MAG: D-amino-acid transaminase [Peptococcaceae bacterium]|nr:D-amino-acid transaminase [Peptococcaceae bacterium]
MADLAWINGEIVDLAEAKIPFLDHGYFFGYGVYEALKVYEGKPFALEQHLDRFERSMREINIVPDFSRNDLKKNIINLIKQSQLQDAIVYFQVTRGVGPRSHSALKNPKPPLTMFITYLPPTPSALREKGAKVIILKDERWAHPYIKTLNLLPNILAKEKADRNNAYEAILVRDNDIVSEASSSNVFAVFDGEIITHPTDGKILAGISRAVVLKICEENDFKFKEDYFTVEQLKEADEVFLTNTSAEVLPVTNIEGDKVGNEKPGIITNRLYELFLEEVKKDINNFKM